MRKESKIYIAGHKGLVGSAIVQQLKQKGFTNLLTRTHSELDLTQAHLVADFFRINKPEYVILAAAKVGGILANNTYRGEFIYDNLMIQTNIIQQSYINRVKKLLFLGSTCIYPKECSQPIQEESLLTGELEFTNEPYAIAKIAGIKMCEAYNLQYGTNFICAMPTNLYGKNDNFDLEKAHVLPALIRKFHLGKCLENKDWQAIRSDLRRNNIEMVNHESSIKDIQNILAKYGIKYNRDKVQIEIWGTGTPKREFMFSEDMAEACLFLLENKNFNDLAVISNSDFTNSSIVRNTHVNIGTGSDISIKALCKTIQSETDFQGEYFFNKNKPDGTMRKLTDVSKLNKMGWVHKVAIKEGIKLVYNWYKLDH